MAPYACYGYPVQYVGMNAGMGYSVQNGYYPQPGVYAARPKMENVVLALLGDFEKNVEDQSNCRFIQNQLEEIKTGGRDSVIIQKLYEKVLPKAGKYMCLPFGNYLCQKLFELLNEAQLHSVLRSIEPTIEKISRDLYGTRSVQQLIKVSLASDRLRSEIIGLLKPCLKDIVTVVLVLVVECEWESHCSAVSASLQKLRCLLHLLNDDRELLRDGQRKARLLRNAKVYFNKNRTLLRNTLHSTIERVVEEDSRVAVGVG